MACRYLSVQRARASNSAPVMMRYPTGRFAIKTGTGTGTAWTSSSWRSLKGARCSYPGVSIHALITPRLTSNLMCTGQWPNGRHEQNRNGAKPPKTEVFWVLGTPY